MKKENNVPKRTVLEEIGNAVTHGAGSVFAVVAFILMLLKSDTNIKMFSTIVYFLGMFIMFTMSSLYHSFKSDSLVKRIFRRFDYLSIYLLIGATYTPILLCYIGGNIGKIFCVIQWLIIIIGVTFVSVFGPKRLRWLHFTLYFILGWCGIIFIPYFIKNPLFFFLILGGGVVYTLGIIPFALKKKGAHFIWHFFVLFGAAIQWIGIYLTIYL